ncbi:MAG: hypothetical protein LBE91_09530 [Tannerella sp.]|jgi:hypothetical protein|nr:hypothetical protein [Tannerella sp.]
MKFKNLIIYLSVILFAGSCNNYDDTALWNQVNKNAEAIAELKAWQAEVNGNIAALQGIVTALQNNDFVTQVIPVTTPPGGYTIRFSKSGEITIMNGAKGDTGAKGDAPQIGVEESGGVYYWTVDGELLLDDDGEKIPVNGENGITPQLRINETDNYWEISYDDGETWDYVLDSKGNKVKATGPQGTPGGQGDAIFAADGIDIQNDYIEFTLADGTTKIRIPRFNTFSVSYLNAVDSVPAAGRTDTLVMNCPGVWRASTNATWIHVSPNIGNGDGIVYVEVEANGTTVARTDSIFFRYNNETDTVIVRQKAGTVVTPACSATLADAEDIMIFPADNAWNKDISTSPVHPNSVQILSAYGGVGLHADFGSGGAIGIPYVVVCGSQPKIDVTFTDYGDESDTGPYAIPLDAPIEGNGTGDAHVIAVDKDNGILYELFAASVNNGKWEAASGAIFDLNSNDLRPDGWTSADAAGLPIFPGLVRYEEILKGEIDHPIRFTLSLDNVNPSYIAPARHKVNSTGGPNSLPMGARIRLRADYDISGFSVTNQIILTALKKYGLILADIGSNMFITGAPDERWDNDDLQLLQAIKADEFEVIAY